MDIARWQAFTSYDPPPMNWSTLRYVFRQTGGPECRGSITSRKRSSEAAPGRCVGIARQVGGRFASDGHEPPLSYEQLALNTQQHVARSRGRDGSEPWQACHRDGLQELGLLLCRQTDGAVVGFAS